MITHRYEFKGTVFNDAVSIVDFVIVRRNKTINDLLVIAEVMVFMNAASADDMKNAIDRKRIIFIEGAEWKFNIIRLELSEVLRPNGRFKHHGNAERAVEDAIINIEPWAGGTIL